MKEVDLLFSSIIQRYLNTVQPLPVVSLCDSFSPICSLEIGLLDFHKREPSCYEELLLEQQVINIASLLPLSLDSNRINVQNVSVL